MDPSAGKVSPAAVRYTTTYLFDESLCTQRHYFRWEEIENYEISGGRVAVHTTARGGGYIIVVAPSEGLDRWEQLLPQHGVKRI